MTRAARCRWLLLSTLLAGGLAAPPAEAQDWRWVVNGTLSALNIGGGAGWGYGPEVSVRRNLSEPWGGLVRVAAPIFGTNAGGVAIDVGPAVSTSGSRDEIGAAAGLTFLLEEDNRLLEGGVGAFAGVHFFSWLGDQIGLVGQSNVRFTFEGGTYPSFAFGLALRF